MQRVKPGTDPGRSQTFLKPASDALDDFGERRAIWEKDAFRPPLEEGQYLCGPLDGIWARAPYLHDGSVPTLRDLLRPAAQRPRSFFRGNRRYDPKNLGFVTTEETEGARVLFRYDTVDQNGVPLPGNGNMGHEFGTDLTEQDRDALLAYLKTL
jgi:cytochrome c peroxidase